MTSKELDERIDGFYSYMGTHPPNEQAKVALRILIRDCIEAVRPDMDTADFPTPDYYTGYESAVDEIEANTKELLGGEY